MILVQDLLGTVKVQIVLGPLTPGEFDDPVQVGPYDVVFRGGRRQFL